jgi:ketosteroid isomerase-like protein
MWCAVSASQILSHLTAGMYSELVPQASTRGARRRANGGSTVMPVNPRTSADVLAVLTKLADAYTQRDLDAVMALFATDPDLTLFGTGADERRLGTDEVRAQIQRDFDQSEAINLQWGWYQVAALGPVAWVAAEADAHVRVEGHETIIPLRFTLVCEQYNADWRVIHAHLSSPTAGQEEGQSFPA